MSSAGTPTLHHLSSSQSLRVLWALEEIAGANSTFKYNLKTYLREKARAPEELKSIHPLGKAPILTVEPAAESNVKESRTLTESRLILQFIADNYSQGAWEPATEAEKTRDAFWQEFANATLGSQAAFPMIFELIPKLSPWLVRPVLSGLLGSIAGMMKKGLPPCFQLMEEALSGEYEWFAGNKMGLADFNLSWPMDFCTQRGYFDGNKFPKCKAWLEKVHAREAYKRALEKGGPYDLESFDYK